MLAINQHTNAGFSITFDNGWTASIQFAKHNCCSNQFEEETEQQCQDAEIAALNSNSDTDEWHSFGDDTIRGWVNANEIVDFLVEIRGKKPTALKARQM